MAVIHITNFGGIIPALLDRSLPAHVANQAENLMARTPEFRPLADFTALPAVLDVYNPVTVHRLQRTETGALNTDVTDPDTWLAYSAHTLHAKWPVNDDETDRTTVSSAAGSYAPLVIDATGESRLLGVPPPEQPTLTVLRGDYFTEEDRDAMLEGLRAQVLEALRGNLIPMKVGADYTDDLIEGYLESGPETGAELDLHRSRVHRYSAFEGTITDAYTGVDMADVAWVRATHLGVWIEATGTPAWMGAAGEDHYALPYFAYGRGYDLDDAGLTADLSESSDLPTTSDDATEVLLHFDGANGATTTTDSSGHARAVTITGAVVLSTTAPPLGTAAADFNGGRVEVGAAADWTFLHSPNTKWMAEFRIRFDNFSALQTVVTTGGAGTNGGITLTMGTDRRFGLVIWGYVTNIALTGSFATQIANDTNWHKVRLSIDLSPAVGKALLSIDDVACGEIFRTGQPSDQVPPNALRLGQSRTGTDPLAGGIDEFVIFGGRTTSGGATGTIDLLTSDQIAAIVADAEALFDPTGPLADPVVTALKNKVTEFEALLDSRPQGSTDETTTGTDVDAAKDALAAAIYDRLAALAGTITREQP